MGEEKINSLDNDLPDVNWVLSFEVLLGDEGL